MHGDRVPCQFKNLDSHAANRIYANIKTKLHLQKVLQKCPLEQEDIEQISSYDRKLAYFIRLHLRDILTSDHRHVWFHIETKSLDEIEDRSQLFRRVDDDIQVTYSFGSMLSYDTFVGHTNDRRMAKVFIPKTFRRAIRLETSMYSMTIHFRNIDPQILINHSTNDNAIQVVFMLKAPPIIALKDKQRTNRDHKRMMEEFLNCTDLLIRFYPANHAWIFLRELPIGGYARRASEDLFHINFAMIQWKDSDSLLPLGKPSYDARKNSYGLDMLWSLGHLFQDKYKSDSHIIDTQVTNENFYDLCCTIWRHLKSNHCYQLRDAVPDRNTHRESPSGTNQIAFAIVTPCRTEYQPMQTKVSHRGLDKYPAEDWLLVHFRDNNAFEKIHKLNLETRARLRNLMLKGIQRGNRTYKYFGSSCSQMNEQAGWFLALPQGKTMDEVREEMGDFSKVKNVATYIARVGLYLTTSKSTEIKLKYVGDSISSPRQGRNFFSNIGRRFKNLFYKSKNQKIEYTVEIIKDVERNGYCFTDGCGTISLALAREVAKSIGIRIIQNSDIPSAFQIRVAGCKGMVAIDPNSKGDQYYVRLRSSMVKFDSEDWTLHIVDHSRPMPLSLNNQVIRLLSDLGVSNGVFEAIQTRCIDRKELWHPPPRSYLNAIESLNQTVINEKRQKYGNIKHFLQKNKIPLPVNEARCLFGIPDETGTLKEGECFIQCRDLKHSPQSKEYFPVEGTVIVTKMPCLFPGDVRKLQAVLSPKLENAIRDCIVFSTKGNRPSCNQMAGSDLDGDLYWVYWGLEISIAHVIDPLSYTPAPKTTTPNINNELIVDHTLDTLIRNAPGIICNTHKALADKLPSGTLSKECQKLAELFARAIDARKTGEKIDFTLIEQYKDRYCQTYPAWMMKFNEPLMDPPSKSINEILYQKALDAYIHPDNSEDILRPHIDAELPMQEIALEIEGEEEPKEELSCCRILMGIIVLILYLGVVAYGMKWFYEKFVKGHI